MIEEPLEPILDRKWYKEQIEKYFSLNLDLLREMVNYGTNMIPRCFESSNRKIEDVVIVVSMFKHAVGLLDSLDVQLRNSVVNAAMVSLRSLWEATLYLAWVLESDTVRRARMYYVHDIRQQLAWENAAVKGTRENAAFTLTTADALVALNIEKYEKEHAKKNISILEAKLNMPECRLINDEFENLRIKGKKLRDGQWYSPAGLHNIREVARAIDRESEYVVFYQGLCRSTHGQVFRNQVRFTGNQVIYEPIREFSRITEALRLSYNFAHRMYGELLEYYRPLEVENYKRKYIQEWRKRFINISRVRYEDGKYKIDYLLDG